MHQKSTLSSRAATFAAAARNVSNPLIRSIRATMTTIFLPSAMPSLLRTAVLVDIFEVKSRTVDGILDHTSAVAWIAVFDVIVRTRKRIADDEPRPLRQPAFDPQYQSRKHAISWVVDPGSTHAPHQATAQRCAAERLHKECWTPT